MEDIDHLNMPAPIIIPKAYSVRDKSKAHCPNCGQDIHGKGKMERCFRCGQRLDWTKKVRT